MRFGIVTLVGFLTATVAPIAHAASGLAPMTASEKFQLKGCGKLAGTLDLDLRLLDAGTWSIGVDGNGYAGTYATGGKGGRTLTMTIESTSLRTLQSGLRAGAGEVCGGPVDAAVITLKALRVKLDRTGTKASLLLRASLSGDGNPLKSGRYRLKGKGTLGPLPSTTSTLVTTSSTLPSTTSTLGTTTSTTPTSTVSTTSTTVLASTTTVSSTTTSTSIVPTGYGDCVNLGLGACMPSEACITGVAHGEIIGLCSTPCEVTEECPATPSGTARLGCDAGAQACLLFCDGGETCPDGMQCVDGSLCVFTAPCTASCDGRACGDDGCGGTCGGCDTGMVCLDGQCFAGDSCAGRCGTFDGTASCQCDDSCLGESDCCADICTPGVCDGLEVCACVPDCAGRACGSDGCFGSCGMCDAGDVCTDGAQCASGDSCLDRCETVNGAAACQCDGGCDARGDCCADLCSTGVCDTSFVCTCVPDCGGRACGSDGCFGSCGECLEGDVCSPGAQCVPGSSCVDRCDSYDDGAACQCDGNCFAFGDCCPGICDVGVCETASVCTCEPDCAGRACGSDGCFGSCGDCPAGDVCTGGGQCVAETSCLGRCGMFEPAAACQCDPDCVLNGDCCLDICDLGVCSGVPPCAEALG